MHQSKTSKVHTFFLDSSPSPDRTPLGSLQARSREAATECQVPETHPNYFRRPLVSECHVITSVFGRPIRGSPPGLFKLLQTHSATSTSHGRRSTKTARCFDQTTMLAIPNLVQPDLNPHRCQILAYQTRWPFYGQLLPRNSHRGTAARMVWIQMGSD